MKKLSVLFIVILVTLTSCAKNSGISETIKPQNESTPDGYLANYIDEFTGYTYMGEIEKTFSDRHFKLESIPTNTPQDIVVKNHYYDISGDFNKLAELYCDDEALQISVANIKKNFNEGVYIKEYVVKNLITLKKDDVEKLDTATRNLLQKDIEKYDFSYFTIVKAEISMTHSEKALELGPQLGNGDYTNYYLCGKVNGQTEWKIYGFYWG